jgi:hypothetical protein
VVNLQFSAYIMSKGKEKSAKQLAKEMRETDPEGTKAAVQLASAHAMGPIKDWFDAKETETGGFPEDMKAEIYPAFEAVPDDRVGPSFNAEDGTPLLRVQLQVVKVSDYKFSDVIDRLNEVSEGLPQREARIAAFKRIIGGQFGACYFTWDKLSRQWGDFTPKKDDTRLLIGVSTDEHHIDGIGLGFVIQS